MTGIAWRGLLLASLATLPAGCGSSPPLHSYVLGDPTTAAGMRPDGGLEVVELMTVTVPDYLDTSDILLRTGPNQVTPSPTGRWGERLSVGMTRALAAKLSAVLPGRVIETSRMSDPDQRLQVAVDQLDVTTDGKCQMVASWLVTTRDGRIAAAGGRDSFHEAAESGADPAIAAALTRLVDQLAGRIQATIGQRPAPAGP